MKKRRAVKVRRFLMPPAAFLPAFVLSGCYFPAMLSPVTSTSGDAKAVMPPMPR